MFRIDHYLGKETVQNILALRFANQLFEPVWNANYVDHVQITMAEDIGIGGRAGYYDGIGAARDVIQNHLLQLMALIAMEEPISFDARSLRIEKQKILASRPAPGAARPAHRPRPVRRRLGRRRAGAGLPARRTASRRPRTTETFAAIKLEIDTRRWAGVPFYLRTGKRLGRRVTEVAVVFKRAPHLPFTETATEELGQNALVIRVQPDEGVTMRFGSKVPGTAMEIRDVNMDFAYGGAFIESSPEAYERLILDVLLGDPPLFPQHEEVELSWQILDPILDYWAEHGKPEQLRSRAPGARSRRSRCWPATAAPGGGRERATDEHRADGTNASQIAAALLTERRKAGSPAMGMVLTFVVVTDEGDALRRDEGRERGRAASTRRRILGVILRARPRRATGLDAEVRIGEGGPGEAVLLRMSRRAGQARRRAWCSPLLLPDSPVVCWWPGKAPEVPANDPLGMLAQRRITDAAAIERGRASAMVTAGARTTPRQHRPVVDPADPVARACWPRRSTSTRPRSRPAASRPRRQPQRRPAGGLAQPTGSRSRSTGSHSKGPGITDVKLVTGGGAIDDHADRTGCSRQFSIPDAPNRPVALKRRELAELLAEELRRLDPDDVYARDGRAAVQDRGQARHPSYPGRQGCGHHVRTSADGRPGPTRRWRPARTRKPPTGHRSRKEASRPGRARRARRPPQSAAKKSATRRATKKSVMPSPTVIVHRNPEELASAVCARLITTLVDVQSAGRVAHWVLTGGTIADKIHAAVAATRLVTPSTGAGSSSGGATSASSPRTTTTATSARRGRPCSTSSGSTPTGCTRCRARTPGSTRTRPPRRTPRRSGRPPGRGPRCRADVRRRDARRRPRRPRRVAVSRAPGAVRRATASQPCAAPRSRRRPG